MKHALLQDAARTAPTARAAPTWMVRLRSSTWAKPAARAAMALAALVVLAAIGHSALATPPATATLAAMPSDASPMASQPVPAAIGAPQAGPAPPAPIPPAPEAASRASPRGPATPDDPVLLNDATVDDLLRLPGIGTKRAQAILQLRARVGRFHQIEDLMRVKGIGRATLRKLRPLVRLAAPPPASPASHAPPSATTTPTPPPL